jgi:hypothetical protein
MGFSITWCAIPEDKAEQFLGRLGLTPTGETEEFPTSLIATAKLDTGWRILWYNKYACPFLKPRDLAASSNDFDVPLCLVEEHVMASSSELWSGGHRKWRLSYEGENGPSELSMDGDLPTSFPAIRQEMEALQLAERGRNETDVVDFIFEIPLKVAQSLVGFKHDEASAHLVDRRFAVMSRIVPTASFFSRLFGK